jgi:predicted AlkP superfamily pyrophosphatase or phosphodiesterase
MKLLIIQAAALSYDLLQRHDSLERLDSLTFSPMETVFPAVTCTAQASFRTASTASEHGMAGNGFFHKDLARPMFWEQSSTLISGDRIWKSFREKGKTVAMLFWQQSLGEDVDIILSPAPIHKHHGGMIQSCYSKPDDLYSRIRDEVGRDFDLKHYWGPMASRKSSDWIASATAALLNDKKAAPDLCLTYLPVLDYDLQRFGPNSPQADTALETLFAELQTVTDAGRANDYEVIIFGDYAIAPSNKGAILPNLALRDAGLFKTRDIRQKKYPDFYASSAFAIVDHEVAHIHTADAASLAKAKEILGNMTGIEEVMDQARQKDLGIDHERSGDLVVTASDGYWFAYPWWNNEREAPEFASHVDIHNKPGYDPCELFMGSWLPPSVSQEHSRIKGTHGKNHGERRVALASSVALPNDPTSLVTLADSVKELLENDND